MSVPPLLRALRVHQWSKNLLLGVPLFTSHRLLPPDWWPQGLLALGAFSLCASATYLVNDLLDREADRHHPTKRHRALAAGHLGAGAALALALAALLLALGLALAVPLGPGFLGVLGLYLALTLAYSLLLKRVALLDVIVLAALYTLRILAGHVVFDVPYSEWLFAFAVFVFLGLALVKRYGELLLMRDVPGLANNRRGYTARDAELVAYLGVSSTFLSVLVLALYINTDQVRGLYRNPELLWLAVPVLLYWLARVWRIAHHGQMDADPVSFALTDVVSYVVGALLVGIVAAATGLPH